MSDQNATQWTTTSPTTEMTLSQVIAHLSRRDVIEGILTIGSTGTDSLTPASDYDVVLVLSEMPVPFQVALTYIDRRLADVLFVTKAQIQQVLDLAHPVDHRDWTAMIVRWLMKGQIVFDRSGQIERAQQKVRSGTWLQDVSEQARYGAWFKINYNLAQTRRLGRSDDPTYLVTADVRMSLYGPSDLLFGYWEIRKLQWEGDKKAIRYLAAHDPAYLELFRTFLQENDRERKLELYEHLAAKTTAPLGSLWSDNMVAFTFDAPEVTPDMTEIGLRFWQTLFSE